VWQFFSHRAGPKSETSPTSPSLSAGVGFGSVDIRGAF
jgi:hypothetical protein